MNEENYIPTRDVKTVTSVAKQVIPRSSKRKLLSYTNFVEETEKLGDKDTNSFFYRKQLLKEARSR
jgi:hypothetical protein